MYQEYIIWSRIHLSEEEAETLVKNLEVILGHVDQLSKLDLIDTQSLGGIDLTPQSIPIHVTGESIPFTITTNQEVLDQIRLEGLSPEILFITPTNVPLMLKTEKRQFNNLDYRHRRGVSIIYLTK